MPVPATPCVKICVLDPSTNLCRGCGRNIDEIGRWSVMDDNERAQVMTLLDDRLSSLRGATAIERNP